MPSVKRVEVAKDCSKAVLTFDMAGVDLARVRILDGGLLQVVVTPKEESVSETHVIVDNQEEVPAVRFYSCPCLFVGFVAEADVIEVVDSQCLENGDLRVVVKPVFA